MPTSKISGLVSELPEWQLLHEFSKTCVACSSVSGSGSFFRAVEIPGKPEHNWIWSAQGVVDMHRPERWGYVKFSKDASVPLVPDFSAPARNVLHDVYYAQRAFRKMNGKWAKSLGELGAKIGQEAGDVSFKVTDGGWEASVSITTPGGARRVSINHESRVQEERK